MQTESEAAKFLDPNQTSTTVQVTPPAGRE